MAGFLSGAVELALLQRQEGCRGIFPVIANQQERFQAISDRILLGRWADPGDLAGLAVFLASDASAYITGQVIFIDGGYMAM